jgi:hypothetical protein
VRVWVASQRFRRWLNSLLAPIVKGTSSRIQYRTSTIKDLTTINLRRLPVAKASEFAAFAQLRYINAELRKQIDSWNSCGLREVE